MLGKIFKRYGRPAARRWPCETERLTRAIVWSRASETAGRRPDRARVKSDHHAIIITCSPRDEVRCTQGNAHPQLAGVSQAGKSFMPDTSIRGFPKGMSTMTTVRPLK